MLLAVPDLLASLMGLLAGFREIHYALRADIEKRFHKLGSHPQADNFYNFFGLITTDVSKQSASVQSKIVSHCQFFCSKVCPGQREQF